MIGAPLHILNGPPAEKVNAFIVARCSATSTATNA